MNFTQMHERLRLELLRRIERGTVTVSLLARQTGFGQSHLSNFLHSRRQLSLEAVDRILSAQRMAASDLLPANSRFEPLSMETDISSVPVISHTSALNEPFIRSPAIHTMVHLPSGALQEARAHASSARRSWQRFVAIRITAKDALPMDPLVLPDALAVIDRHYNSIVPYRSGRNTLFAARHGSHLALRFLEFQAHRLILRPHNLAFPIDLIEVESDSSPSDFIVGRVVLVLNET